MTTWSGGGNMDQGEFAGQFFGRSSGDPVVTGLRTAALTARMSSSQGALRDAAEHLASALQAIGLDRLPRFLDDAEARANDPSTLAALAKSQQPLGQRDAIRPVYPVETAIDELRRVMGRPATIDPKLSEILEEIYRPNAKVGSGSTADALRTERATGQPVGGRWHEQKAKDMVIRLERWLNNNPLATAGDRAAAENVLRDLQNALERK